MDASPISPETVDLAASLLQGVALYEQGRIAAAAESLNRVLQIDAANFQALHLLGIIALLQHEPAHALALLDRATRIEASQAAPHYNRGVALLDLGRYQEALAAFAEALRHNPGFVAALVNSGNALQKLNTPREAVALYDRALRLDPARATALNGRGNALRALECHADALESYDRALLHKPDFVEALCNRGVALGALKRHAEALTSYERALQLQPDYVDALNNCGASLRTLCRYEEALASYARVLQLQPEHVGALSNRGVTLQDMGRPEDALANFVRALEIKPDDAEANHNEGMCRLLLGDYQQGWKKYEWRWRVQQSKNADEDHQAALWLGEQDLAGKSILVHAEQGLGDTLQFCRYVGLLAARGAEVFFEVQAVLLPLLANLSGARQVLARGQPRTPSDYHCPLLSLPLAFDTGLDTVPTGIPYLTAQADLVQGIAAQLAGAVPAPALRVGLCWKGGSGYPRDAERSPGLAPFDRLLALGKALARPVEFFTLVPASRSEFGAAGGVDLGHEIDQDTAPFAETAALIMNLDLVISCDTAIGHLAGALGKPVWLLLSASADWRWLMRREDSPWYPNTRLFRQTRAGDWTELFERVARRLMETIDGGAPVWPLQPGPARSAEAADVDVDVEAMREAVRQAASLHQQGRAAEAEAAYLEILRRDAQHVDALHFLGVLRLQTGRADAGIDAIRRSLAINPNQVAAYNNLGNALLKQERHADALAVFDRAIALAPDHLDALYHRGNVLRIMERDAEALRDYDHVLRLRPDHAQAHNNRGNALRQLARMQEALASYQAACTLQPDFARAWNNLGNLLQCMARHADAVQAYEQALQCDPAYFDAWRNHGNANQELHRHQLALESYRRALEIQPDDAKTHFYEGFCRLLLGDFALGWQKYQWRWQTPQFAKQRDEIRGRCPQALWSGREELRGKSIFLCSEQGFGDVVQFCRYANALAERGATVYLEAAATLKTLLESLRGVFQVVLRGQAIPLTDYYCPLLDLPLACATTMASIPAATPYPYLSAPAASVRAFAELMTARGGFKIGICWKGGTGYSRDAERSIGLAAFQGLFGRFRKQGVRFLGLVPDGQTDFCAAGGCGQDDDMPIPIVPFAETAALMTQLDLVITCDTAIGHVAGACGVPVWILLPYAPDWRWMLERSDSPWYPSARLFRQERHGDWDGVMAQVASELARRLFRK